MKCSNILKQTLIEKVGSKEALYMFGPIDALHRKYGAGCFEHLEELSARARMLFGADKATIIMVSIRDAADRLSCQLVGATRR